MNIIIFEDQFTCNLKPFTYNHASFEVKTGLMSNLDRFNTLFADEKIYLIVRPEIKNLIKEKFPSFIVNPKIIPQGFCINGKVVWKKEYKNLYLNDNDYIQDDALLVYNNIKSISIDDFFIKISSKFTSNNKHSIVSINYLWDAIDLFEEILNDDFNEYPSSNNINNYKSVYFINKDNIKISNHSAIKAGSVLDAENGPIIIGKNVLIDIGSKIQGPVFIDNESYIAPGSKIRSNCLIGNSCKIGGEVSNSIFHAYSNKVHDGFLGHSYVGEWVNIGAGTNNSNLKNNYSQIKFKFDNREVQTKRLFLGSMIGDFTRIGIATMLNTGTFIGFGANVFGSNFQNKFIQSFSWGDNDKVNFDKFIHTCSIMKKRRKKSLSSIEKDLIQYIYNNIN